MRIATNAANLVAAYTKLLTSSAMAGRTSSWISTSFAPMRIVAAANADPPWRMWIAGTSEGCAHAPLFVTRAARALIVTSQACARRCMRFVGVTRCKTRLMDRVLHRVVEGQPARQRSGGAPVARCAGGLRMTCRAHARRRCGSITMIAQPRLIVHQVARWQHSFGLKIFMTDFALAWFKLRFVGVTR